MFDQGKSADAIAVAKRATEVAPGSPNAHFLLGRLLKAQYQNADAEEL